MTIKMIIATDQNFGIGKDNKIPWNCPEDLQYFKEQTSRCVVIMGRKTFDSLPFEDGLPNRINKVITSTKRPCFYNPNKVNYLNCPVDATFRHTETVWVIGGSSLYLQLLPQVEEIHHTTIDGVYDCDTFFDMSFLEDWKLVGGKDLSENAVLNIYRKS